MSGLFIVLCSLFAAISMWNGIKLVLARNGFAKEQPPWRSRAQEICLYTAVAFCVSACILLVIGL